MPTTEQLRNRLIKKLAELFQLDQPDLDFGFYRIMHAKAQEVQDFIGTDLLKIVADAFGDVDETRKAELQAAYEKAIEQARKYGAPVPEETDAAKESKAALDAVKDTASAEADVYDHLYRFFERYYDNGDFISRRYYTRETSGKAAPFAVPYNGEEVKLHWANADQYYIKSTEYFSNFTFDLIQAAEIRKLSAEERALNQIPDFPHKVHFCVAGATEGEHGNVKASDTNKRFFILHAENPLALTETGELVVNFEYRPDSEKTGQEKTWRDKRNAEAVETILERLQTMAAASGEHEKQVTEYLRLFKVPAPTDGDKKRPVLAKYVNQYTARNTMDYFIHKDLGDFLRRELDFYIKNEVMRLDDIENAEAPAVEGYLAKIKVLRKIANKLIDFLAQLEDFQKKLWLKKKFIIETNYCITLDRVPEELYPEIATNEKQCKEWITLFAIDEIQADLHSQGFSQPLTIEFLKANNKLVLDTHFFDESFKARLLASIENFDEQCDGLLIHSENFQALNLLQERYREQVKCIYIDPPYNTASTPILYKNEYRHSSWAALMWDRLATSRAVMKKNVVKSIAIDDTEMVSLSKILENIYPEFRQSKVTVIHNPKGSITKDFNRVHEYCLFLTKEEDKTAIARTLEENKTPRKMRRWGENSLRTERRLSFYPIYLKNGKIVRIGEVPTDDFHPTGRNVKAVDGEIEIWPIDQDGVERRWNFGLDSIHENLQRVTIQEVDNTLDLFLTHELTVPKTVWTGGEFDAGNYGNTLLINILGSKLFDFPKSINLVKRCIYLATTNDKDSVVLDYFGGSGTTAHATIELNKKDNGTRKYLLVEMGAHFDNVLKPRTQKITYASEWKDGKPTDRHTGISHCFKYIRLESYEDTLNNLQFDHNPQRQKAVAANPALKEDYMLSYLLDVETRGSQSLLNIDAFGDPTAYNLDVKKPGTDEYATRAVDLIETFNYLIGLRVLHSSVPQTFTASFKRIPDPELPEDQHTKLMVEGRILQEGEGPWWFRKVEGWVPKDPANPNNGQQEKVLIVWRKLTSNIEQDNLMLDEWFQKNRISTRDFEFDTIYVNGSNNLPNLRLDDENWKVRLIEEEFMKRMWNNENA
jgi:adenine-specific DNA-methyltransferase